jgi:site-specific DNA-methyltransferase (adenine-specific)
MLSQYDTFIRQAEAVNIIEKVNLKSNTFLSDVVYSRKPFGLDNNYRGKTQPYPDCISLYGSYGISYISISEVKQNVDAVTRWKVIASKASAQGGRADKDGMRKVIPKVEVLPPNYACTESYLLIYDFDNEDAANRAASYIRSKLFRFLLSLSVITQNISKESFRFVPQQDFTANSDIDWSQSVADIDRQLYEKYHLIDKEIAFIESMIKPM